MTIRIGMISFWHVHAWDYAKQAQAHKDTEIVAAWDERPERGREQADKLGVPFFASLDEMLREGNLDAVIVNAPTAMHREVIGQAARAGKHVFTEKVLAPTWKEANELLADIRAGGGKLIVSLPRLNDGYTLAIQDILGKGLLGKVTQVRTRLSHNGATADWLPSHFYDKEATRGGALIDLGCHPMYLARLFLGEEPLEVSAQFGHVTGKDVEDNAVALLRTGTGAIGVVEAGFVNSHSPFAIEAHGTDGTLLYGTPHNRLLLRSSKEEGDWKEWPLPAGCDSAFHQWVGHIRNGTQGEENVRLAVELTKLMEAANRSAAERRSVRLDELAH